MTPGRLMRVCKNNRQHRLFVTMPGITQPVDEPAILGREIIPDEVFLVVATDSFRGAMVAYCLPLGPSEPGWINMKFLMPLD